MSEKNCPFCQIKELSQGKFLFRTDEPIDGRCPDCGAYIDLGQHSVEVNLYRDIYEGTLELLSGMVEVFNEILAEADIELEEYMDTKDGAIETKLYVSDILEKLFVPYHGGTTRNNFKKALGITENEIVWKISKDEVEDETDSE